MFLLKFCNVLAAEAHVSAQRLADIIEYHYISIKKSHENRKQKRSLRKKMRYANSYAEWKTLAQEYDLLQNVDIWKETDESDQYDWKYIRYLTRLLTELKQKGEYIKLIHVIRSNAVKNLGNILNPTLYSRSFTGTKNLIEAFHKQKVLNDQMIECIEYIATLPDKKLPKKKKLEFFSETRHAFGRTALTLSGGASLGQYHYGVMKCLIEEDLIPRVISGSSAGSIFASLLCTKTVEELEQFKDPSSIKIPSFFPQKLKEETCWRRFKRLVNEGFIMEVEDIKEFIRGNVGDITFQEAYDKTGWILNIVVTGQDEHDGYRLLNYLSAPNVLIWSAVCASCAVPYIFASVDLYCKDDEGQIVPYMPERVKRFVDGTLTADVPLKDLSEMFNVNHVIVSQVNPAITVFLNHSENEPFRFSIFSTLFKTFDFIKDIIGSEIKHRINQIASIGFFPRAITRYFTIFTQKYSGNVTIWIPPTKSDARHLLDHPCTRSLKRGGILGARATYYKLNHVEAVLGIERALRKAHMYVRQSPDEIRTSSGDEVDEIDYGKKINASEWKEDSLFSSDEESEGSREGSRLSSFMVPRSPSSEILKLQSKSSAKRKSKTEERVINTLKTSAEKNDI